MTMPQFFFLPPFFTFGEKSQSYLSAAAAAATAAATAAAGKVLQEQCERVSFSCSDSAAAAGVFKVSDTLSGLPLLSPLQVSLQLQLPDQIFKVNSECFSDYPQFILRNTHT